MPPARYVGVLLWRTAVLWLAFHTAAFMLDGGLSFSFRARLFLVAVTVALLLLDARRRSERRFFANLGVGAVAIAGAVVGSFLAFEVMVHVLAEGLLR